MCVWDGTAYDNSALLIQSTFTPHRSAIAQSMMILAVVGVSLIAEPEREWTISCLESVITPP